MDDSPKLVTIDEVRRHAAAAKAEAERERLHAFPWLQKMIDDARASGGDDPDERERPERTVRNWPRPPDGLLTADEAAARLRCSVKTLNGYVASGSIRYVQIGHGCKRPRKMFTIPDLDDFVANQTRKDVAACPSLRTPVRRSGVSTSSRRSSLFRLDEGPDPPGSGSRRAAEREKASATSRKRRTAATSLRLDDVAGRYWHEVGQHHAGADNTWRQIDY